MASVTQCDVCPNVVRHEKSLFVEIYRVTKSDNKGAQLHAVDLCPDCYVKLCELLGLEAKTNANSGSDQAAT